ncbi:MAG: alpha/beta fold hydrolase [Alphaproteobacteria bacterium]|nr:alpha/beta fold hydrolase [Alphaproteobacteria bacterium]
MSPLLLLLVACSPDDVGGDSGATDAGLGDGGGDGGTEEAFADPSLPGAFVPATAEDALVGSWGTELTAQIWYPAASDDTGDRHAYDDLVEGGAVDGGAAACDGPRPVVVFSHGNGGVRWQSFFLTEHLASHGFVVIAPDHAGNTLFEPDGTRPSAELTFRRPVDVADSFDHLVARSQDPDDVLAGCVDPDAGYAVVGHSYGGYTALAVAGVTVDTDQVAAFCAEHGGWLCGEVAEWAAEHPDQTVWPLGDPRAWASVPLAPAAYETLQGGLSGIGIPVLVQAGTRDSLTPWEGTVEPIYEGLQTTPRAAAIIEDAGHYTFSDVCQIVPVYEDCEPPFLDPEEAHPVIATLTLAWLQQARGFDDAAAWLPGDLSGVDWRAP